MHPRLALALCTILCAIFLIAGWLLTRPGALLGPQDGTWYRSQINKDLYVGLDPNYPPFTEWTPDQIEGIEADIAREIGNRLGVTTSILIMGYDGLYDSLYTGYVDMIIFGLSADPAYEEWVYYSRPYYDAGQILVSRVAAPVDNIRELDGKTVAVELASAGDIAAQRWVRRLHALDIQRHLLPDEAMHAVQLGEADAALVDTVSARLYLADHDDLRLASKTTVANGYVIAMRKANFRLNAEVDQALADMIADGTLDAIIARWL
ncbi:MAG: amino acid ABC transporter substrate-binding protein [Anaerolineae bacterium]|nr:amino acid ABC transporter substrate-binding protein [Anaerolineae bacterium]